MYIPGWQSKSVFEINGKQPTRLAAGVRGILDRNPTAELFVNQNSFRVVFGLKQQSQDADHTTNIYLVCRRKKSTIVIEDYVPTAFFGSVDSVLKRSRPKNQEQLKDEFRKLLKDVFNGTHLTDTPLTVADRKFVRDALINLGVIAPQISRIGT